MKRRETLLYPKIHNGKTAVFRTPLHKGSFGAALAGETELVFCGGMTAKKNKLLGETDACRSTHKRKD